MHVYNNCVSIKSMVVPHSIPHSSPQIECWVEVGVRVTRPWGIFGEFTSNSCAPKFFNVNSYIDTKAFSSKQLLAKFTPLEEVTQAVTDLVVLSASRKEDVPAGYRRLPYVYSKQYTPMLYCYIQRDFKHIMKMIFFFFFPQRDQWV